MRLKKTRAATRVLRQPRAVAGVGRSRSRRQSSVEVDIDDSRDELQQRLAARNGRPAVFAQEVGDNWLNALVGDPSCCVDVIAERFEKLCSLQCVDEEI